MRALRHAGPTPQRRLFLVCAVLALTLCAVVVPPTSVKAQPAGGLERVGELPIPWFKDESPNFFRMIGIDTEKQVLYTTFQVVTTSNQRYIVEHDLSTPIPTPLRISEPGVTVSTFQSPYSVAFDQGRDRMLLLSNTLGRNLIEVVDLKSLTQTGKWEFERLLPGFTPVGIRYDQRVDRFLVVGEFSGSQETAGGPRNTGNWAVGPGPAVVALEGATGAVVWVTPLRQCHSVMTAFGAGALLAQSIYRPALYVFCAGGETLRQPVAGQNGLVRIDISGHERAAGVANFPSEFFPVSGTYTGTSNATGITGFDPRSERFYAQSLAARTPGAWVFDGLRDSWVGFIAAPDNRNHFFGVDPTNGKQYMGGSGAGFTGYVNVTDGRATPIPQGTLFDGIPIKGQILTDPTSNRLFAPMTVEDDSDFGSRDGVLVMRDTTESIVPLQPTNYDALTKDLPDSRAVVQYSAGSSGFGASFTVVGGWESAYSRYTHPINPDSENPAGANPAGLAYGDRGVTYSAVPAVDIRPSGASATAAAGAIDQATDSDRRDRESQAPKSPEEVQVSTLTGGQTCLNGGGPRVENRQGSGDPERVVVVCDLGKRTAEGFASYADDVNGGGQSLGASSFDTRTFHDPKRGVVTETTAVARGLSLRAPGGGAGGVSIDKVTAVATTVANGRPGTTKATWQRTVEGAVISDNAGEEQRPRSCTTTVVAGAKARSEGDCGALQQAINSISTRVQVRFPAPVLTATPKGAFARVEERETDYLNSLTSNNDQSRAVPAMEVVVYNDGPEKGRLLAQYAAIDANSIFTRSSEPMFPDFGGPTTGSGSSGEGGSTGSAGGEGATAGSPGRWVEGQAGAAGVASDVGLGGPGSALAPTTALGADGFAGTSGGTAGQPVIGWLIGARGPRDAALAAGIWLLFAGALSSMWRRRRLIATVEK